MKELEAPKRIKLRYEDGWWVGGSTEDTEGIEYVRGDLFTEVEAERSSAQAHLKPPCI